MNDKRISDIPQGNNISTFTKWVIGQGIPIDHILLPCDILIAPATILRKGVRLSTLLTAFEKREVEGPVFSTTELETAETQKLREMINAVHTPPGFIAKAKNGGRYLAETNDGGWLYLNHADTWQAFKGPGWVDRGKALERIATRLMVLHLYLEMLSVPTIFRDRLKTEAENTKRLANAVLMRPEETPLKTTLVDEGLAAAVLSEEPKKNWNGPHATAEAALDETRRTVAKVIGADPETWPDHGNAPLAIAATLALYKEATDKLLLIEEEPPEIEKEEGPIYLDGPFHYVPMPVNKDGIGPETEPGLIVRVQHEVWNVHNLCIGEFPDAKVARAVAKAMTETAAK